MIITTKVKRWLFEAVYRSEYE